MANEFKVKNGLLVSGSANINASGSGVFTVDGTSGRLFQIDDSLSGSLFSVNTAAGLPIIEAFSDNTVRIGQYGQRALFVSQSKVGIGKESALNGLLDISGSVTITGSINVSGSITGSLLGTASFATSASQAITASYVLQAVSASFVTSASFATTAASATTASYVLNAVSASFASTASSVNTLNQNVIITGSLIVGSSSLGASENTITLGARDAANEGGQIGFNAPGGTYTSASFIDNWQNNIRILRGTNATSDATVASWNLHTKQMQLPQYTSVSSFPGTATANLAVDSGGNIITVSTTGGTVFPYTGNAVITGSLTVTQPIYVPVNGGMYFQGGDDVALHDINISNHMGIYGVQDSTVGSIKLGSGGGIISGRSGSIGIGTTTPNSASLHVSGNVWATSFTGSLQGTSSWATNALTASSADNFTVRNTLTAQTIVVQTITSSVDFVTGSTRFGSLISNTHLFTGSVGITGSLTVVGPVNASSFTGSILGTASFATNADALDGNHASAFVLNSQTSSMSVATASFVNLARSASYVLQAVSASFATSATNATTASYLLQAVSASFATSASRAISSSFATNADTVDGVHASSFVLNSQTSSMSVATASYILNAVSASNANLLDGLDSTVFATTGSNIFNGNQTIASSGALQFSSSSFSSSIKYNGLNVYNNSIDISYPTSSGLRFGGIGFDGVSFQGFGGLEGTGLAGQMYFDYGSNVRTVAARSANFRNNNAGTITTVMSLDASSNVLIGTTSSTGERFQVSGSTKLNGNVTLGDGVYFDDLNNRLGIGVSSPTQVLDVAAPFAIAKFTSATGTNASFFQYVNTGGNFFLGAEGSTGATFGATAYAGVVYKSGAYPIEFFTNGVKKLELKSTGQLRLNGYTSTTSFTGTAAGVLAFDSSGNILTIATPGGGGGGTPGGADTTIQFNDGGTFSGSGNFTFTKVTNTVKIQGSGSVLLHITGSQGDLFKIQDSGSSPGTLAVISSGSRNIATFTTSSVIITGSLQVSGSFTASLQSGYVWVGDSSGVAAPISTASIGGGGTIDPKVTAAANLFLYYNY